jgi:hypothetical protein
VEAPVVVTTLSWNPWRHCPEVSRRRIKNDPLAGGGCDGVDELDVGDTGDLARVVSSLDGGGVVLEGSGPLACGVDGELLVVVVLEWRPNMVARVLIALRRPDIMERCMRLRLTGSRSSDCDIATHTPVQFAVEVSVTATGLGTLAALLLRADFTSVEEIAEDVHAANACLLARDWPPSLVFWAELVPDRVSPIPLTPVKRVPNADDAPLAWVSTARMIKPTIIRAMIPPNDIFWNIAHPCTATLVPGINFFSVVAFKTSHRIKMPSVNSATTLPTLGPMPASIARTTTPSISRANVATGEPAPDDDAAEELPPGGRVAFPATDPAGVGVVTGQS